MNALVGCIYISTDYATAMQFVLSHLQGYIDQAIAGKRGKDYKTLLQEFVQRDGEKHIHYQLLSESGPDHAKHSVWRFKLMDSPMNQGLVKVKN